MNLPTVPDLNIDHYEHNAGIFFAETVEVDMSPLYRRFLPLLQERARILDAGCGSGRDAKAFVELGHQVAAFDASPALVGMAERHVGEPIYCLRFQDITWQEQFDGIWACASLLHVPAAELPDVMQGLCKARHLRCRGFPWLGACGPGAAQPAERPDRAPKRATNALSRVNGAYR